MGLEPRHPGVAERAQREGVLHDDVLDACRPQAAPQLRELGDIEPREVRDVHGGSAPQAVRQGRHHLLLDRKSTRLNSSHLVISYAVFCLKKKKNNRIKYV